ncbi:unnamed protein product [Anisakis simplex]|uniref:DUF19 domain-containing protein n=1 Tax=Anisakis simplex TaxID=6269 RepID=A0A0M3K267_ANISI|nr:unnamed protein product [Anisakis simplex]
MVSIFSFRVVADVEELNCYIYHGFSECITMMNLCMKDKSNEGRPLAVSEWECAKSQIIIANCKTLYGPQCEILQEECAVATGSARVKIGNGGVYQMPIPLRNCIAEGGAMAMCKVHHDHTKCNTWKVQCYTALGLPVTSTVIGKYEKLPTPVALCVSAQDLMARCKAAIGTSVCDLLLDECRGRFGSPSITLSSNSLYSLSPQLINCIQHRYKRTSPFIRQ